jgi:hypothetical protein
MEEKYLDERQEKYLNWLVVPAPMREPASKEAYARENQIDVTTLRRWEKKPYFKSEWQRRVEDLQGSPERTQKLLDTIYQRALDGDNKAAHLYLQATNRLAPTQITVEHSNKPAKELTDAELEELISGIATREKDARAEIKINDVKAD